MDTADTLDQLGLKAFNPPKWMSGALWQTIFPYYIPFKEKPIPGEHIKVQLEDGDQLLVRLSLPKGWKNGQRIVVLIHGLAGSEESPYLIRMGEKLFKRGYAVVKVNLRGCGPGRGLARYPYHSGRSEDTKALLKLLLARFPDSPVTQIGFSLSANITLKMLGEANSPVPANIDSAIAVSPPLDLTKTAYKITEENMRLFEFFFLLKLKRELKKFYADFPDEKKIDFPKKLNMIAFDNNYTAPRSGYDSALDYYAKVSSDQFVPNIAIKTLILHSVDDPVVESNVLHKIQVPDCIDILEFERGGHVGFYDKKGFWMDEALLRWVHLVDVPGGNN